MSKNILYFLFFFSTFCIAQNTETKYYNNKYLRKEVKPEKAKFSKTIIQYPDGTITTEVRNIENNEIYSSETYKGYEPFGKWKYRRANMVNDMDFDFEVIYFDSLCKNTMPDTLIKDFFQDEDSINYIAPKIVSGETSIYQFISKRVIYPARAIEENITGTVYLTFIITKAGEVENITIKRGKHILLDKEAVRVLRELKFSNAPILNGKEQRFCMILPVKFSLR